jgi:RNA polymerase-associated protein LEO1
MSTGIYALNARDSNRDSPAIPDDGLSEAERQHRKALEYEEDDQPDEVYADVVEANVAIPNVPIPKSSDGNVSLLSGIP